MDLNQGNNQSLFSRYSHEIREILVIILVSFFLLVYRFVPTFQSFFDKPIDFAVNGIGLGYGYLSTFVYEHTGYDFGLVTPKPDPDFIFRVRMAAAVNDHRPGPLLDMAIDQVLSMNQRVEALLTLLKFDSSAEWIQPFLNELAKGGLPGLYDNEAPALLMLSERVRMEGGIRQTLIRGYAESVLSFMMQHPKAILRIHAYQLANDLLGEDAANLIVDRVPLESDAAARQALAESLWNIRAVSDQSAIQRKLAQYYDQPPWPEAQPAMAYILSRVGFQRAQSVMKSIERNPSLDSDQKMLVSLASTGHLFPTQIEVSGDWRRVASERKQRREAQEKWAMGKLIRKEQAEARKIMEAQAAVAAQDEEERRVELARQKEDEKVEADRQAAEIAQQKAEEAEHRKAELAQKKAEENERRQAELARQKEAEEEQRLERQAKARAKEEARQQAELARVQALEEKKRGADIARAKAEEEKQKAELALARQEAQKKKAELAKIKESKDAERRAELARLEAEKLKEKERLAEEARLKRENLEAERKAEKERQLKEAQAQKEKLEAERKAEAEKKAERERQAKLAQEERDRKMAAIKAEQARLEAERIAKAKENAARLEAERVAKEKEAALRSPIQVAQGTVPQISKSLKADGNRVQPAASNLKPVEGAAKGTAGSVDLKHETPMPDMPDFDPNAVARSPKLADRTAPKLANMIDQLTPVPGAPAKGSKLKSFSTLEDKITDKTNPPPVKLASIPTEEELRQELNRRRAAKKAASPMTSVNLLIEVKNQDVPLYANAGFSKPTGVILPIGTKGQANFKVVIGDDEWYQVKSKRDSGWANGSLLTIYDLPSDVVPTIPGETAEEKPMISAKEIPGAESTYFEPTAPGVSVYEKASDQSKQIGTLEEGVAYQGTKTIKVGSERWFLIEVNSQIKGWVKGLDLQLASSILPPPEEAPKELAAPEKWVVAIEEGVPVYSRPSIVSRKVRTIGPGESFKVSVLDDGSGEQWYKIHISGRKDEWVQAIFMKVTKDTDKAVKKEFRK